MKAVVITRFGGPEVLEIQERATPRAGPGQVLVAVRAVGLNRADLLQRRGRYPAPPGVPADIPGLEYAGTVLEVGSGVTGRQAGDRVMGIVGGGAFAEYVVVHERETLPIPRVLSFEQAAAIPEAFITAFDALCLQCRMEVGDRIVVHAVGSGVGTAAIQLARASGCVTVGTSRTPDKLKAAVGLGLDHPVLVEDDRFLDQALGVLEGRRADIVMDFVGAPYLDQNLNLLRTGGQLVLVGLMGGGRGELPMGTLLTRRLQIRGTTLRTRPLEEKIRLARAFEARILPMFDTATLRPVLDRVLPMDEVRKAHEQMERNQTFGKVVLTW